MAIAPNCSEHALVTEFDPAPVPPLVVAHHFLWLRRETTTTPTHIHKLVYLAHGWMLAIHGRPLIDEPAEVWRNGPVIPRLYHRFKSFAEQAIVIVPRDSTDFLDPQQAQLVREVNVAYQKFEPWALSTVTQEKDTPWDIVHRRDGLGAIIPNDIIRSYYEQLAKKNAG